MSYILDALRKAERDRQLGRTPTLEDVTHAPLSAKKAGPSARTLALIGLVLGLAIALVLVMGRSPDPALTEAPIVVNDAPAPAPVVPVMPGAAPVQDSSVALPDPIEPALNVDTATESLDDLLDPLAQASVTAEPVQAEPEPPAATSTETPVDVASVAEAAPAPAISEPQAAVGPKLLRDLPESYRSQFPVLRVDVHVYDEEPTKRWVMVNGAKYLEASTLAEGPRISEISAEGMVLDYRGEVVLVPLNR